MIFDTHAHYDDEAFDEDRDMLLAGLPARGIGAVVNIGASVQTTKNTLELTRRYPFVYGAIGVHPNETGELNDHLMDWLGEMTRQPKVVAVGEIGLDYYWDTLTVMKEQKADEIGGVIHCFSYGVELAREYLNMGFYLGIGGVLTFKNAKKLKEVAEYMPMDRMVLETDCPYLSPVPFRGKRNSSLYLPHVVKAVSEIKGVSEEEVIRVTWDNGRALYRLDQ